MSENHVIKDLLLPSLKLIKQIPTNNHKFRIYLLEKTTPYEVCPKCATKSYTTYDHVIVNIKDAPIRNKIVIFRIRKRRFLCKNCKSIFREPVPGIYKYGRTTQRFRKHLMWSCLQYSNLKRVAQNNRCSDWLVFKAHYEQLEFEQRKMKNNQWPKTIGIDEHSFKRNKYGRKDFVTIFVDYNNRRVREVTLGRSPGDLLSDDNILFIPGRENVKNVILDLSNGFKCFAKEFFPNATLIADKFHVIKLLTPAIQKYKREVIGKERRNPFKKLLQRKGKRLNYSERRVLRSIIHFYPNLKEVYTAKEAIHTLYDIKGYKRARNAFIRLTDWLAYSKVPEIQTFRRTLMKWREEILNYFKTKLTNGRTEGYNRKAKLIQRNAYGYKNFNNYRLKILYTCR